MSQENVELVLRAYAAFSRGDIEALVEEYLDERAEWHASPEMPDADVHVGREGVRRHLEQLIEPFEEVEVEVERTLDLGDRILVLLRSRARGRRGGMQLEARPAHLWTVRDGRGTHMQAYMDHAEALEAVGLSE